MKIYLVGGAVRDQLLNYPSDEKDWVVVGATPEDMIHLGYRPVGKDFPVFLHPESQEEYALARTERKVAAGYTGFTFNTDSSVTLEQDLIRRDLTINAIAQDTDGALIDPYNGQQDIADKLLRHVSGAFVEDPVRILRVARFAARYHHLGFQVAEETMTLMRQIVARGEAAELVAERVWKELTRALGERHPAEFIIVLQRCNALAVILPELDALFGVPQPEKHHPEIDTGVHMLQSLTMAAELSNETDVRFAVLLHDLGKALTPKEKLPHHYGHEKSGLSLIKNLCSRIAAPKNYRQLALAVAEYHTHCHRAFELKPSTLLKTLKALDAFRRPEQFEKFLLACEADARGRTGLENSAYPQANYFRNALKACNTIEARNLVSEGFKGAELGTELDNRRCKALTDFKTTQGPTYE